MAFNGAGVYNRGGTATLTDTTVDGNTAPFGSYGGVYSGGSMTIIGGEIVGNSARDDGGLFNGGQAYIAGCTISGSVAMRLGAAGSVTMAR